MKLSISNPHIALIENVIHWVQENVLQNRTQVKQLWEETQRKAIDKKKLAYFFTIVYCF